MKQLIRNNQLLKREFKQLFSLELFRYFIYIPLIVLKIKNWVPFLSNYAGLRNSPEIFTFRAGTRIKTRESADAVTTAVVFIKKDYGDVENGSEVIDIGANIGVYSVYATSSSKNTTVYAYEPVPEIFRLLLENIRINNLESRIFAFPLAVGAREEKRKLFLARASPWHSLYSKETEKNYLEVTCTTLRDIFDENNMKRCDLLKIDCEGAEYEILYSTPSEYFKKIKSIRLEYHQLHESAKFNGESLIHFLKRNGFRVVKLKRDFGNSGTVWLEKSNGGSG